MQGQGIEEDSK